MSRQQSCLPQCSPACRRCRCCCLSRRSWHLSRTRNGRCHQVAGPAGLPGRFPPESTPANQARKDPTSEQTTREFSSVSYFFPSFRKILPDDPGTSWCWPCETREHGGLPRSGTTIVDSGWKRGDGAFREVRKKGIS